MTDQPIRAIALACSPSKGFNSDSMLDAFIEGMQQYENIAVEKIYLNDIPIDMYSYNNRLGPTEHEAAFKELTDKIRSSTGLIIATPTYNFGVPAHLKNFIDRIRFFALDFERKNTLGQPVGMLGHIKTYFPVSGGTPTWAQKILFFAFPPFWLRGVFLYYSSACLGAFYTGNTKAFEDKKILATCRRKGAKYARRLLRGEHNRILERLFWRPPQES